MNMATFGITALLSVAWMFFVAFRFGREDNRRLEQEREQEREPTSTDQFLDREATP
jgi:hypothetical protein